MKTKYIFLFIFLILIIMTFAFSPYNKGENEPNISLITAYKLGLSFAVKEDNAAGLIFVNSVDDGENNGEDGKKSIWNLMFSLPNKEKRILIIIKNGEIDSYKILNRLTKRETIQSNELNIDSVKAIDKAIKEYNLQPGKIKDFFNGYHFRVQKEDKKVFFSVVGFNTENQLQEVYFNAKTGRYFGVTVK